MATISQIATQTCLDCVVRVSLNLGISRIGNFLNVLIFGIIESWLLGRAPTYKRLRRLPRRASRSWRTLAEAHRLREVRDSWQLRLMPGQLGMDRGDSHLSHRFVLQLLGIWCSFRDPILSGRSHRSSDILPPEDVDRISPPHSAHPMSSLVENDSPRLAEMFGPFVHQCLRYPHRGRVFQKSTRRIPGQRIYNK